VEVKTICAFILLQIADFITTLIAISLGGAEKNPLVGFIMGFGIHEGLLVAKLIVIALGLLGAIAGKYRGLRMANIVFAGVVLWNVTIIGRLCLA
jgi:hypothetical protein